VYIKVRLPRSNEIKKIHFSSPLSIAGILEQMDINPDTCITLMNKNPVPIDTIVEDEQEIEFIEVTSGG